MATVTTWELDPAHTTIEFAVKHMMFTTVRGRFRNFTGTIKVDEQNPNKSRVEVDIDVIAALRVVPTRLVGRRGQRAEVARRALVFDHHLLVELFGGTHRSTSSACATPATRRSTSSCVL